jgi:hypothetical protein
VVERDPAPAFIAGDPNFGQDILEAPYKSLEAAYAVNPGAPSTLYALVFPLPYTGETYLVVWDAATGAMRTVASLGIPSGGPEGFTIDTAGGRNVAYAAIQPGGAMFTGYGAQLYRIDLATGAPTSLGKIDSRMTLDGLTVGGLPPQTIGAFDPSSATWYLRNSNTAGAPGAGTFQYGGVGWLPVTGDWNGDGVTTVGVVDPNAVWYLRNENSAGAPDVAPFPYGLPGWVPVTGDWSGSGRTGIGMFDPGTGTWYLHNSDSPGSPDFVFQYGAPGWIPVVGDWDGNGTTTVGVFDPATGTWYLRNSNSAGAPDAGTFAYGLGFWTPVVGDWTGKGTTGIGIVDPTTNTWYLRGSPSAGIPDAGTFSYGAPGWRPLTGTWGVRPQTPKRSQQQTTGKSSREDWSATVAAVLARLA